jgi:16S rRNA (adenine1518-N6/adenine1519-N6)-dimethyltransferase
VESIVIKLDRLEEPRVKAKDTSFMFELVRAGFNMRRKTLWNAAKTLKVDKVKLEEAFEKSGIDPKRRAETLTLEEFAILSDCIYEVKAEN